MEIVQVRKRRYLKFIQVFDFNSENDREVLVEEDTIEAIQQDKKYPGLTIIICDTGEKYTLRKSIDDIVHLLQMKE